MELINLLTTRYGMANWEAQQIIDISDELPFVVVDYSESLAAGSTYLRGQWHMGYFVATVKEETAPFKKNEEVICWHNSGRATWDNAAGKLTYIDPEYWIVSGTDGRFLKLDSTQMPSVVVRVKDKNNIPKQDPEEGKKRKEQWHNENVDD